MAAHRFGIVTYDGVVHAWGLGLYGCVTGARDLDALREWLPLIITEHLWWLRKHGEDAGNATVWEIDETLDGRALSATGGEFCFDAERAQLSPDDLEAGIARIEFARSDLLAEVDGLPDAVLDWEPPATAIAAFDAWAPEARTIRGIVQHTLQLEAYYRDGLCDGPARGIFDRVGHPSEERARTVALLRSLDDEARSRVYRPVRPGRAAAEDWTVRKVLRRIISHERHHAAEIAQRKAWLQVGVPRLRDR